MQSISTRAHPAIYRLHVPCKSPATKLEPLSSPARLLELKQTVPNKIPWHFHSRRATEHALVKSPSLQELWIYQLPPLFSPWQWLALWLIGTRTNLTATNACTWLSRLSNWKHSSFIIGCCATVSNLSMNNREGLSQVALRNRSDIATTPTWLYCMRRSAASILTILSERHAPNELHMLFDMSTGPYRTMFGVLQRLWPPLWGDVITCRRQVPTLSQSPLSSSGPQNSTSRTREWIPGSTRHLHLEQMHNNFQPIIN